MEEDKRGISLRMDNLNSNLIREINMSGLQIGEIYYVLKSIFKEIENLYTKQAEAEYKEFCDKVNAEAAAQESEQFNEEIQEAEEINKKEEEKE